MHLTIEPYPHVPRKSPKTRRAPPPPMSKPAAASPPLSPASTPSLRDSGVNTDDSDRCSSATSSVVSGFEEEDDVEKTLKVLSSREEDIIRLRFGIGREMPYTLEEIGRVMGLSRERVRQIEASALKKIQQAEEQGSLREFLA